MRITEVRAVQPVAPGAPADWRTIVGQIVVAVDTDVGLSGYGVGGGGAAGIHVVVRLLRDVLLGKDPVQIESLWNELYRVTLPFGRKGLAIMAQSGVDLALWDLRGKAEGLAVSRLLCQSPHSRVPVYASLGTDAAQAAQQGFRAVKLHLPAADGPQGRDRILAMVSRARDILGPDVRLMTDAFMRWDVATTLELARQFEPWNVEWIEEPLAPDDFEGYARLMAESPIPIAGGEHEYTAAGFADLVDRHLHAILQPDVTWCGGLTQLVEIYRLARRAGVRVCQHRGAEVWGLHAVAAFETDDPLAEAGRPWMTWVLDQPPVENGWIQVPDGPGFGVRIDESQLP